MERSPGEIASPKAKSLATWWTVVNGALAAVGYWVAFSTPTGGPAVLLALPCLFLLGRVGSTRKAFYVGLIVGVAMYAPHLAFFRNVFGPAGVLLWLIAGMPIAIFILLLNQIHRRLGSTWALLLSPILWTGVEFFRSELYYLRFAWLLAGQAGAFLPGARLLWAGVYGLGFVFAVAAAMTISRQPAVRVIGVTLSIGLAVLMFFPPRDLSPVTSPLHVAGVQFEHAGESTIAAALDQLALSHPEAQILVLSEYTFHGPIPDSVRDVVRRRGRFLIVGGEKRIDDHHFYDKSFVIGPDGKDVFSQGKSVPVQFMDDGLPAPDRHVWNSPWGKIGIAVCYDISYAQAMDDFVREGAQALILPTMDLENWGRYERRMLHGRMGPTRAAEYGVPVFSVWSSGESQLIDRSGRIIARAGYPGQGETLAGPLDLRAAGHIPPDRWFAKACTILTGGIIVWLAATSLLKKVP